MIPKYEFIVWRLMTFRDIPVRESYLQYTDNQHDMTNVTLWRFFKKKL